ncbi:putative F-box protein At1g32420 [Tasmannia lanceolata]|uniref:putative F-box protein At1g32420 n=1 Tax=Tasmannia lanceolata TaxID=3420 RepID=UPI00406315E3
MAQAGRKSMDVSIIGRGFQDFPYEIIFNILSLLPAISLVKVRCVCKLWCDIVNSPGFIDVQLKQTIQKPTYLIGNSLDQNMYIMEEEEGRFKTTKIGVLCGYALGLQSMWGSSNGLLCYSNCPDDQSYQSQQQELIYLCNPITQDYKIFRKHYPFTEAGAFGFHPLTKEYKVIRFFYCDSSDEDIFVGEILTLGTESWRAIESVPDPLAGDAVCVNGVLYWMVDFNFCSPHSMYIVSFDLKDEKFRKISGPIIYSENDPNYWFLITLGEHLTFVDEEITEIWLLKDHQDIVWTKVFTLIHEQPEHPIRVLGPWGHLGVFTIIDGEVKEFGAYNLDDNRFTSIEIPFGRGKGWMFWSMTLYSGTLVSPKLST